MSNEFGIGVGVGVTSSSHPYSTTTGGMTGMISSRMNGMTSGMTGDMSSMSGMGATQTQTAPINMQTQVPNV